MANEIFGSRIQAPQLRPVGLQPAAIPGSTFVRPVQREAGGNLRALADSLGGLNNALQNYNAVTKAQEEDPESRANREWKAKRSLMSREELIEDVKSGSANGIRIREDAQMSLLGEKAASDSRVEMEKFFFGGGFDLSSGDPEAAYQQKLAEYAEALPNDLSKAAFYRAMEPHRQRMMDGIGKQKVSYMEGQRNSAVVDTFRNIIDDDLAGGKLTATQIAQNVFSRSASNRDFLGLSGDEQNETIFEIAKEYAAKGRPDIVEALLRETRIGADGEKLPAIGRIAKYGTESLKLVETAKDVRDGKVQEDGLVERNTVNDMVVNGTFTLKDAEKLKGKGLFTTKQLGDMVSQSTQNRLSAEKNAYISDLKRSYKKAHEDGKQAVLSEALSVSNRVGGIALLKDREIPSEVDEDTTTYTTKQIKDDMVSHMENQWDARQEQLIANGTPPEQARKQVFGERVSWYGNNGIVNKQWDALLNGIASRSTTEMLVERGHVPEALVQHAELYRDLKATNPAYLSTVMQDAKSKTFLEAYQRGVEILRLDKQGALHYAATRVTMDPAEEARSNLRATEIDSIVNSTMSALGLEKRGPGYSQVYGRVMEMSKSGSTREEIKDNIQKDLETNSVVINGSLVPTSRDLPPDFPELMEMEIQDVYEFAKEREGVESVDDLTVIPVGDSGKWMVVSKSRGYMPLGSGNLITAGRLDVRRSYRRQQEENRLKAFASAKETERDKMREELIADLEKDRANIVRWRKKSGPLSRAVADRLEENFKRKAEGRGGFFRELSEGFSKKMKATADADRQNYYDQMKFYEDLGSLFSSALPSVTIGGSKLNNGWSLR